jgi:hypothetical protein
MASDPTQCFKKVKTSPSFFASFRPLFRLVGHGSPGIPSEACSDSLANASGHS